MSGFRASAFYRETPASIEATARSTEHALAEVRRTVAESVREVVNWNPAFALEHTLHYCAESLGHVPTYQAFREFVASNPQATLMLLQPSRDAVRMAVAGGASSQAARDSVRWRIGNAYLAFLKEAYVTTTLRAAGVDARYHPIADVLFRVDAWAGETCICVFVSNKEFRAGSAGRKVPAELRHAGSRLKFCDLELPTRAIFGSVHLPERVTILNAARAAGLANEPGAEESST